MKDSLVDNIQQHFLLFERLARDSAAIAFFANNHFGTGKEKTAVSKLLGFCFLC